MKANDLLAMWNQRHSEAAGLGQVASVLEQNSHLIAPQSQALDLACGRGANALYLARQGMKVTAWDLSPVAIERLDAAARTENIKLTTAVRDVIAVPPEYESFDLILVSYFLDRALAPAITRALRP